MLLFLGQVDQLGVTGGAVGCRRVTDGLEINSEMIRTRALVTRSDRTLVESWIFFVGKQPLQSSGTEEAQPPSARIDGMFFVAVAP